MLILATEKTGLCPFMLYDLTQKITVLVSKSTRFGWNVYILEPPDWPSWAANVKYKGTSICEHLSVWKTVDY